QRLVRGGGHEVGMRYRVGIHAARHQAGVVGDINHEQRAVVACDARHALEVDAQRIGGCAAHDQLGLVLTCQLFELVVVELFLFVETVGNEVVQLARGVDRRTMSQVAAFREAHTQYSIAGLQHSHVDALVRLRTGIRLNVGGFSAKDLLQAVEDRKSTRLNSSHVKISY